MTSLYGLYWLWVISFFYVYCLSEVCANHINITNITFLQAQYFETLRNYNAFVLHKKLHCTSFVFREISEKEWIFEFSGVTNRTQEFRVFQGKARWNPKDDCLYVNTFQNVDPSLLHIINQTSFCFVDGDKQNSSWFLVQDSTKRSTFSMVSDWRNQTLVEKVKSSVRSFYPHIDFQDVYQGCSFRKPPE